MKAVNLVFVVLFVLSAALQYNDPDPYVWMPIYLYGAWLCYEAFRGRVRPLLYAIGIAVYSLYAAYLFFDHDGVLSWAREHQHESLVQTMKATKPWIEETREFGGLGLLIGILALNWLLYGIRRRRERSRISVNPSSSRIPV